MAQIARTSPTHDQIALWLVENPGPRQTSRCAVYFGYTLAWMSTIMHSDAFRARLAEVQGHCDAAVAADIPAKLRGVAGLALDGLAEQVDMAVQDGVMAHREFLKETADMALHRLGYAPQKMVAGSGPTVNNNLTLVSPEALAIARQHFATLPPGEALTVEALAVGDLAVNPVEAITVEALTAEVPSLAPTAAAPPR